MTVRAFVVDTGPRITCDEGTLDTFRTGGILNGAWTAVCVFKRTGATSDGTQFMFSASSAGSLRFGLSYSSGSALQVTVGGLSRTFGASFTISNNTWYVFAVRLTADGATPQAKLWNAGTGSVVADWTNGSGTLDFDTNAWDQIQIGNRVNDFPLAGKQGGIALYSSALDNTTGDTLGTGLQEWLDASPVGAWFLQQASTSDPVLDEVGDADQTAINATSVDTGDDPAAFDLTLGGGTDDTATPAATATTISIPAATPSAGSTGTPASVALTTALPAASASASGTRTPTPLATAVALPAASVSTGSTSTPGALAAAVALPAAATSAGSTASPAATALAIAIPAPTVTAGGSATAAPATLALAAALPSVGLSAGAQAAPAALALAAGHPAAAATGGTGATASPSALALAAALPAALLAAGATPTPAALALTIGVPQPTIPGQEDARGAQPYITASTPAGRITSSTPGGRL